VRLLAVAGILRSCAGAVIGAVCAALLMLPPVAAAGTLTGLAKNGTTGQPAAGIEIILIQLQGGMQPVANTKSDAQGHFKFDNPEIGTAPMLLRAVFNGINFHEPVPPGKTSVEIQVFEPSKDPKTIAIPSRVVFFQPNGKTLIVGEEYSIENKSTPPQAYFRADGNFEFALPRNAKLQQVAASGPAGMPVVQAPIEKKDNHFAIAYAFRPGASTVRYSYELPYPNNTAVVNVPISSLTGRLLVVAPPTMQISGEQLQLGGQEQGMNIYGRENVAAGTMLAINVSGTAPPPQEENNGAETPKEAADARSSEPQAGANIQQIPGRLDVLKWPLVGGFAVLFALGAVLLARKPVAITTVASEPGGGSAAVRGVAPPVAASSQTTAAASAALASVDAEVGNSLDGLKEKMFRLELRHQAGTISEEEYAAERARAEKVLRDLVRG
jgi:hypothetical protein